MLLSVYSLSILLDCTSDFSCWCELVPVRNTQEKDIFSLLTVSESNPQLLHVCDSVEVKFLPQLDRKKRQHTGLGYSVK